MAKRKTKTKLSKKKAAPSKTKPSKPSKKTKEATAPSAPAAPPKPRHNLSGPLVVGSPTPGKIYMDDQRNSCIVAQLRHDGEQIIFVTMENCFVDRYKLQRPEFERRFKELQGYPLDRCIGIYRRVAGESRITERAKRALEIAKNPNLPDQPDEDERITMKAKKTKAPKAAKAAKEPKAAKAPKTAKAPKAAKAPKEPKVQFISREVAASQIKKGGKLKTGRDNDKRKDSLPHATVNAIQSCATVKAALEKTFTYKGEKVAVAFTDLRSAVRRKYVEVVSK